MNICQKTSFMKKVFLLIVFAAFTIITYGQHIDGYYPGRTIDFPNIPGYLTLKTDLHTHTALSDGYVWPNIRIDEALRDGLDAISITDHIEYQPHKSDIPHPDRNRSFEIAKKTAGDNELIVINGAEITRNMPPGHCNAVFLEDVNELNINDSVKAFKEADKQGAFVFWNHPHWEAQYPDGMAKLTDLHKKLIKKGMLHGIEVVNDVTYSDEALQIALDYNLTIMGTSDIHGLVDWHYDVSSGGHRPVTLVFAKEKSESGLKEALFAGRTVAFFNNLLIGREEYLLPLIDASLSTKSATYVETWAGTSSVADVYIVNESDAPFILKNIGEYGLHDHSDIVVLKENATSQIRVKTLEQKTSFDLKFEVLNAVTAPETHPEITITVVVAQE